MKRKKLVLRLLGAAVLILLAVTVKAAQNSFSGTWVLDTEATKGLSSHVNGYDMVVNQNGQQLVIEIQAHGQIAAGESGSGKSVDKLAVEMEARHPQTSSRSMLGSDGASESNVHFSGSLALRTVVPQATYTLDGKKTTVTLLGYGQATLTAKPGKNGNSLDLSRTDQESTGGQLVTALVAKERWTLSDDGQVLKVQRTVSTQQTSETVNLVFRKKSGTP